jgi:hypothetical protein
MEAFNEWLHVPPDRLKIIESIVSMLHNASLLWVDLVPTPQTHSLRRRLIGI